MEKQKSADTGKPKLYEQQTKVPGINKLRNAFCYYRNSSEVV